MHLLLCLNKFKAGGLALYEQSQAEAHDTNLCMILLGPITRTMVVGAQVVMVPLLAIGYSIRPTAVHRFVGYLEETACHTYVNIIDHAETPGTHLYEA